MQCHASEGPNHVHQLVLSVSKHFYATANGDLKYQQKPMDVSLEKLTNAKRRHMVVYAIRDHTSGLFYAELAFAPALPDVRQFLGRAWRPKQDYPFRGLPRVLVVPKVTEHAFPGISAEVMEMGTRVIEPSSGFMGGVRDIRTVEDRLGFAVGRPIEMAHTLCQRAYMHNAQNKPRGNGISKLDMWNKIQPEELFYPGEDFGV